MSKKKPNEGLKEIDDRFHLQGGKCALCVKRLRRVMVDRDESGALRGLLCPKCKKVVDHWKTPEMVQRAIDYVQFHDSMNGEAPPGCNR